jgi:hypothetical protein
MEAFLVEFIMKAFSKYSFKKGIDYVEVCLRFSTPPSSSRPLRHDCFPASSFFCYFAESEDGTKKQL